jgi:S1-C subfamily serine protease
MTTQNVCSKCGLALPMTAKLCPVCALPPAASRDLIENTPSNKLSRLIAAIFDFVVLGILLAGIIWMGWKWWLFVPAWLLYLEIGYRCNGSPGKLLLGLKVVVPAHRVYYFRETIGKLASVATFGIGFALVLTKESLALHDYMAGSKVERSPVPFKGAQTVAAATLAFVVAGLFAFYFWRAMRPNVDNISDATDFIRRITEQAQSVGTVYTYGRTGSPVAQGSAFVVSADGLAATNVHVLEGAFSADCRLGDGRLFQVVAVHSFDAARDVAVIQLGRTIGNKLELPSALVAVKLGSSEAVKVGDRVAVISSPRGLENTVSDGLVSSIRQDEQRRLLQTTAPISNGSSGGPLFNSKGEVIGVTTLQMSVGQNLNFALPVEILQELLQRRDNLTLPELQAQIAPNLKPRPKRTFNDVLETANAAFAAGRYLDALKGYESAQKLDPTESAVYYNAAKCYVELGNSTKAAAMYNLYLALAREDDPDREAVMRWLAEMKLERPEK